MSSTGAVSTSEPRSIVFLMETETWSPVKRSERDYRIKRWVEEVFTSTNALKPPDDIDEILSAPPSPPRGYVSPIPPDVINFPVEINPEKPVCTTKEDVLFHCVRKRHSSILSPSLRSLDLSDSSIHTYGPYHLCEALALSSGVQSLSLKSNGLTDSDILIFSRVIANNLSLTSVSFKGNSIKDEGAKYITYALKKNSSITHLNLAGNQISDEGAKFLAIMMRSNATLTSLNLKGLFHVLYPNLSIPQFFFSFTRNI
eukprot:TRINITY_DN9507_c0_g1_i7.p1 TRINITY_DN9507_c0_g1~~TRINITY_DN9507_c0_g1_i7.p1  ORF type:complete len:257 (-),score=27.34 TRINITY_DN9507_c0_g1_i7:66-836(-)